MKFKRGLAIGLGLAVSLQSTVVFANDEASEPTISTDTVTWTVDEAAEEAATEEVPAEEAITEEVPAEEAITEEVPAEEAITEEVPTEEAATEEVPAEEVATDEAATEEAATEEAVTEEAATEEAATEEAVTEEVITEEIATEGTSVEILDSQVPLESTDVSAEVQKLATLTIVHTLVLDDEEATYTQTVEGFAAGDTINLEDYVVADEEVSCTSELGSLELQEGENVIVLKYVWEF
jgi:hypothetical protein